MRSKVVLNSLASVGLILACSARADMVTDWNHNFELAAKTAAQLPPIEVRCAAIMQTAVFDAVNGIVGKYQPYFVTESAPPGARADAAVAAAAYTTLKAVYPAQSATFDAELAASLASIPGIEGDSESIARGLDWGQHVANLILTWRATDGFTNNPPGFFGGTGPGVWRSLPTATNPDGTLPAVFPQYRYMLPFAMSSPDQFRPGPPLDLTSEQYANDVSETKAIGRVDSTVRTDDQTALARLWQASSIADLFRGVRPLLPANAKLVDNARLLALLSIASCDGLISVFDAKYTYNFWRPYHAIRLADTDGNPLTDPDPTWSSLVFPPRHQEYPSAHAVATGAFMRVLSHELGDKNQFTLSSPGFPSFTWTFARFSDAAAQVKEARIWAGIHFRNSCNVGGTMGVALGDYIVSHVMLPQHSPGVYETTVPQGNLGPASAVLQSQQ